MWDIFFVKNFIRQKLLYLEREYDFKCGLCNISFDQELYDRCLVITVESLELEKQLPKKERYLTKHLSKGMN